MDMNPQHGGEIAGGQHHQPDCRQRPYESTNGIERLTQAEARTAQIGRAHISNESVPRCSADALPQSVHEPGHHQPAYTSRERENGLGERREAITKRGQRFAPSGPIAKRPGENFGDHRGCFSDAFDEPHRQVRSSEHCHEIDRQQRVDHLRRGVHEQAERPNASGDFAKS
jgi:hypothetical protein